MQHAAKILASVSQRQGKGNQYFCHYVSAAWLHSLMTACNSQKKRGNCHYPLSSLLLATCYCYWKLMEGDVTKKKKEARRPPFLCVQDIILR